MACAAVYSTAVLFPEAIFAINIAGGRCFKKRAYYTNIYTIQDNMISKNFSLESNLVVKTKASPMCPGIQNQYTNDWNSIFRSKETIPSFSELKIIMVIPLLLRKRFKFRCSIILHYSIHLIQFNCILFFLVTH